MKNQITVGLEKETLKKLEIFRLNYRLGGTRNKSIEYLLNKQLDNYMEPCIPKEMDSSGIINFREKSRKVKFKKGQ